MKPRYHWDSTWSKTTLSNQNLPVPQRYATAHNLSLCATARGWGAQLIMAAMAKRLYFLIPKGVSLHVRALRFAWPQVQLQKTLFMLCSWQAGINGKNLLLHKAVPHSTGAQSCCLIPDLDGLHLGGKSTTVGLTNCIMGFSQGHTDLPPKKMFHLGIFPNYALQRREVENWGKRTKSLYSWNTRISEAISFIPCSVNSHKSIVR